MIITYSKLKIVQDAVNEANKIMQDPALLLKMIVTDGPKTYDYSTAYPNQLYNLFLDFYKNNTVEVRTYYQRRWFGLRRSPVLAYTNDSKYMYLNSANLYRSLESVVGTILHELSHNADFKNTSHSFGHGDNGSIHKDASFPYYIGNAVYKYLTERRNQNG